MREPLTSRYDKFHMVTAPPPFGGMTLLQALKVAEAVGIERHGEVSPAFFHYWAEIMERCYAQRTVTLADPDFADVPVDRLISAEFIGEWAAEIERSEKQRPRGADGFEDTTHFVVADGSGMCVSVTNTIGAFFGAGLYVHGFFLNGQVRNFSDDPHSPNQFAPGKRPASYVCPTILRNKDQTIAIGSAGGKRIPLTVATVLTSVIKFHNELAQAVARPRFFVDEKLLKTEKALHGETVRELRQMGYDVQHHPDAMFYGGVHALMIDHRDGTFSGAADPRRGGTWAVAE